MRLPLTEREAMRRIIRDAICVERSGTKIADAKIRGRHERDYAERVLQDTSNVVVAVHDRT